MPMPSTTTSTQSYGAVFRALRLERDWTLDQMLEKFASVGVAITSRSGVSHLESRGSDRRRILKAYEAIFDTPVSVIEKRAASTLENKLP